MPGSRSSASPPERQIARLNVRAPGRSPGVLTFIVADCALEPQPCGALWWADERLLVVSDLHLEKGSAYASRGQMLPPYDTRATLGRVARLMERLQPRTVVSLGDSFHDRRARVRMAEDDVALVRHLTGGCDWIWIEGNHDPAPPDDLGGRMADQLTRGPITFRHEPSPAPVTGEVAGHLHPCARVVGRAGTVRARCFAMDETRLVMPAYGALTGGLNVLDAAFGALFPDGLLVGALGRDGVYAAAMQQLAPDTMSAAG